MLNWINSRIKKIFISHRRVYASTFGLILLISIVPCVVISFHFFVHDEPYYYYLISLIFSIIATVIILYPLVDDYSKLSTYVKHLSYGRGAILPKLSSFPAIRELSESMLLLNKSWESKQTDLLEKISEIKLLLESIPEILFIVNDELIIITVDNAAIDNFGNNLVGNYIEEIIDDKTFTGSLRLALHEQLMKKFEISITNKGINRFFTVTVQPYDAQQSGVKNIIILMHEITEQKRMETMLVDFIANASHEIRTPLTGIIGMLETLENSNWQDEEARKLFTPMIFEQAIRMKNLINDLLSLSSIERRLNSAPTDEIDLKLILELAIKQLEWEALQAKIVVSFVSEDNIPLVLGDANELSQVTYNLISNAIKYGGGNKIDINLGVREYEGFATKSPQIKNSIFFSITDYGEGIATEHIGRLSERFYRIDQSRSRKIGGTGLGLAIVKQIIIRHKGNLEIESELGKGSTFTVYLPMRD